MTKNSYNEYSIELKPESPNLKITIKVKSKDGLDGLKYLLLSGNNIDDSPDSNEVNLEIRAMLITIEMYLVNDMGL